MAIAPYLATEGEEYKLDVSVGQEGRQRLSLSDRAITMLVDDLEYDNRDMLPWVTAKTLTLTGAATLREEKTDARTLSWSITGADGGKRASTDELERVADHLRSVEIDQHAVETVEEHVRETRLSTVMSADEIQGKRERMHGLRGIAKDL
ncbi:MAG: hypothetical protein ACI8UR_000008 [Natronomonas sp.]|jgi:hypothetical protein|uniref:hypothetical protein n=1 Tax=Natronomonas sp. TaxID=2184060 RepID=UPI003988F545